ncbi:MAG: hypothetical protein J6V66_05345 [Clostridia bacterium]|nr:hypothetical protein [Clostridia bacterium]
MAKNVSYPRVSVSRITVNSFSNGMKGVTAQKKTDLSRASVIYNFDVSSGTLKSPHGVSNFKDYAVDNISGFEIDGIYSYIKYNETHSTFDEKVLVHAKDNGIYYSPVQGGEFKKIQGLNFKEKPSVIAYNYLDNDVLLLSTEKDGLYLLDGLAFTRIPNAPAVNSLCIHKERLFATSAGEGKSLWFSDDFDPTNWEISLDEAGFIEFADEYGKLLKAVSFLDYVYVFREYGISRVVAEGDQESFYVDNLYGKHGKIVGSSITDCGDFIVMLTSKGIYSFNGLSSSKILDEYDDFILGVENENCTGAFDGRTIYLAINIKINGARERAVITYDTETKTSCLLKGYSASDIAFFGGSVDRVLCCYNEENAVGVFDDSGTFLGKTPSRLWQSEFCNFGLANKVKNLTKISLQTTENCTLIVDSMDKTLIYTVKKGKVREFSPCLRSHSFKFTIKSSKAKTEISSLSVSVEVVN